jgi:Rieske Fe-S protein
MSEPLPILGPDGSGTTPDGRPAEAQPRWRQDFPIDQPQYDYISRRDLVKFLILVSASFTAGQTGLLVLAQLRGAEAPPAMAIARVDEVAVGQTLVFHYPEGSPANILTRVDQETFVAYSQQCTHLLCPVIPEPEHGVIHCPCHEGYFDLLTGRPIAGPPNRPLTRITLEIRDGQIFATGIERRTV